ncbi:2Fe-2S iron-sulfur cluster-binding protein [Marinomonas pontica]|uniref:2Fe-2S iron-sulfur cluster-binding protein n=1 Tax=Marinomonas pontica TaxID=264739 RepID=UPI002244A427|nr:2Fe-2S iron-sulfur cluster-binding protein [Marinomonas pontica]MCW8357139.1 2Fe-2S iron-sulfur cluster-binding protein [Marinomonas pontica]
MMDSQSLTIELDDEPFEAVLGDNLLSSLLSQGADVRYGCCAGVCGACCLYDTSNGESILSLPNRDFFVYVINSANPG